MAEARNIVKIGPNDPIPKGAIPAGKVDTKWASNPYLWYVPDQPQTAIDSPAVATRDDGSVDVYTPATYKGLQQNVNLNGIAGNKTYRVTPGQAAAYEREVQDRERAQYQLDQMLAENGPLMRRAAASGMAVAGQRGLMNSSLAAGAAQGAMMDRAQPYVLSDADAYRQAASESMAAKNAAAQLNAQLRTQANISGAELTGAWDRAAMQAKAEALMQEYQRRWQSGESEAQRMWQSGENAEQRSWQSNENLLNRDWQTGERIATQDWQSGENQLNRDWTSEENMHQRMLQWTTAQLQTYASMRMSENQAMAQVMANIFGNPNLTAAEQRAAWANAQVSFEDLYGRPWEPPEGMPTYGAEQPDAQFTESGDQTDGFVHPFDRYRDDPLMGAYDPGFPGYYDEETGEFFIQSQSSPSAQDVMRGLPDF